MLTSFKGDLGPSLYLKKIFLGLLTVFLPELIHSNEISFIPFTSGTYPETSFKLLAFSSYSQNFHGNFIFYSKSSLWSFFLPSLSHIFTHKHTHTHTLLWDVKIKNSPFYYFSLWHYKAKSQFFSFLDREKPCSYLLYISLFCMSSLSS